MQSQMHEVDVFIDKAHGIGESPCWLSLRAALWRGTARHDVAFFTATSATAGSCSVPGNAFPWSRFYVEQKGRQGNNKAYLVYSDTFALPQGWLG